VLRPGLVTLALVGTALLGPAVTPLRAQKEGPHETVIKEMIEATEQMAKILATIEDAASAAEGRPKLKKAIASFLALRNKAEALKQPGLDERERLARAYHRKLDEAVTTLVFERRRLRLVPEAQAVLQDLAALEARKPEPPNPKEK
jgi:hypothetical protein